MNHALRCRWGREWVWSQMDLGVTFSTSPPCTQPLSLSFLSYKIVPNFSSIRQKSIQKVSRTLPSAYRKYTLVSFFPWFGITWNCSLLTMLPYVFTWVTTYCKGWLFSISCLSYVLEKLQAELGCLSLERELGILKGRGWKLDPYEWILQI